MSAEELEFKTMLRELEQTIAILTTSVAALAEAVKKNQDSFGMVLEQLEQGLQKGK